MRLPRFPIGTTEEHQRSNRENKLFEKCVVRVVSYQSPYDIVPAEKICRDRQADNQQMEQSPVTILKIGRLHFRCSCHQPVS